MALVAGRGLHRKTKRLDSGCVVWTGAKQSGGYGNIMHAKQWLLVHRVFWVAANGSIPAGLTIDHKCRVRTCVNPAHLEVVTLSENSRRANGRKEVCIKGHSFSGSNLYTAPNGRRTCRACRNSSAELSRLRLAAPEVAR